MFGGDLVVALGKATVDGSTLLGHNVTGSDASPVTLVQVPARTHAPGEVIATTFIEVPQVRHTYGVLGTGSEAQWGLAHGINEHGVLVGCTRMRSRIPLQRPGLTGPDLVRLALERGHTALQALEVVTSLITRHGQGAFPGCTPDGRHDAAFVLADAREAFVVEASGRYWICQEVHEVRAVSEVSTVRQDWDSIAPGLASYAIDQGWWPEDGSKLDFAGTLGEALAGAGPAPRRWGRATVLLEMQNRHIDSSFLRRILSDHEDDPPENGAGRSAESSSLCRHGGRGERRRTAASFVAQVGGPEGSVPLLWWAPGPPCRSIYFPIPLGGDVPVAFRSLTDLAPEETLLARVQRLEAALTAGQPTPLSIRKALEGLQAMFETGAAEFLHEAAHIARCQDTADLHRHATLFMQRSWEEFVEVVDGLLRPAPEETPLALSW